MDEIITPAEADALETLPMDAAITLVRSWRNHWAEVQRITADFPEDIKAVLALRPTDPVEALDQTLAQFAVLFHPEATSAFVTYINALLRTLEALGARPQTGVDGASGD